MNAHKHLSTTDPPFLLCNQHIMYSHLFPATSSQATVQENKMIHSMLDGALNIWWSSPLDMPCHFISPFFFLTHRLLHTSESTTLPRHRIQIVITTHFFFHFGLQSFVYVTMVGFLSNMMTWRPRDSLLFEKTLDFECMMVSLMKCLQTFETIW